MIQYPILPLAEDMATGVTTQVQTIQGKNLFDSSNFLVASGWTKSGDEYSGTTGSIYAIYGISTSGFPGMTFLGNQQYTMSFSAKASATNVNFRFRIYHADGSYLDSPGVSSLDYSSYHFSSGAGKTISKITVQYSNGGTVYVKNIQVELGAIATAYANFVYSPSLYYPSPLIDNIKAGTYRYTRNGKEYVTVLPEMGGLSSAPDTWNVDTGELVLPKGILVLDGTEDWTTNTSTDIAIRYHISSQAFYAVQNAPLAAMCSHFKIMAESAAKISATGGLTMSTYGSTLFIWVPKSIAATTDAFKSILAAQSAAGTPVTVIYQLATPVTSTITPTMVWDIPVYDRSDADYQTWLLLSKIAWSDMTAAQRAAWSVPMKGAYNYTDLNRVGMNLLYLQELFADYGYSATVNIRMDYVPGEWPAFEEMSNYVQSISNIRSALAVFSTTPSAPSSMDDGTVVIWNNIEQILTDVERLIENMSMSFRHCATAACGQGGLIL